MKIMFFTLLSFLYCSHLLCMEDNIIIRVGAYSDQGSMKFQEDRYDIKKQWQETNSALVGAAVFGGHNGKEVAKLLELDFFDYCNYYLYERQYWPIDALRQSVKMCHWEADAIGSEEDKELFSSGSSVTASLFDYQNKILNIACVGDTVAALIDKKGVVHMSYPHRVTHGGEAWRIRDVGGKIDNDGYIENRLRVTRSVGDKYFKEDFPGFILEEVETFQLPVDQYDYLILMTSGVYDALNGTDDSERVKDFQTLFFDLLLLGDEAFKSKYVAAEKDNAPHGDQDSSSRENNSDEKIVDLDPGMTFIAERLISVVRSRGFQGNATVVVQSFN